MTITLETPDTWPGSESPTNPSGERRNVLTVNGVEPDNDGNVVVTAGGNMPAAQIIQALQAAFPRLTWLISGNSTNGQPDTATSAAIDAFMAATGVTSDYVAFLDLGAAAASAGTFTIANAYSASSADNVVLVQSHGVLVIADAYSGSFADNVTISNPELLILAIDDAYSGSFADAVTLAQSHGVLAIADAYSASFADVVTLALAGGTLTIADAYSASSADNVMMSEASGPLTVTDDFNRVGARNFSTVVTYNADEVVLSVGVYYKSLQGSNLNHTPSSSAEWWESGHTVHEYNTNSPYWRGATGGDTVQANYLSSNRLVLGRLYHVAAVSANQYSEAEIVTSSGDGAYVKVRQSDAQNTAYVFGHYSNNTFEFAKWVNGTYTALAEEGAKLGNFVRIEANGTTITAKYKVNVGDAWTTWATVTDSSIASGKLGLAAEGSGGAIDNWTGGDL